MKIFTIISHSLYSLDKQIQIRLELSFQFALFLLFYPYKIKISHLGPLFDYHTTWNVAPRKHKVLCSLLPQPWNYSRHRYHVSTKRIYENKNDVQWNLRPSLHWFSVYIQKQWKQRNKKPIRLVSSIPFSAIVFFLYSYSHAIMHEYYSNKKNFKKII